MAKKANNQAETSQETIEAQTGVKDPSEMTSAELKAEILKAQSEKAVEPVEETPETIEVPEETPKVEQKAIESDETPDDLKDKSQAELVKILVNLRKLKGQQDQELGELRKFKKQQEEIQAKLDEQNLSSSAQKMIRSEIKQMSPEEKQAFYDKFAVDPAGALYPLIQQALHPIIVHQAKQHNEAVVARLKESTKDSLVPYDEAEINKIIASYNKDGRNLLFDQYGSEAFQVAYDQYFKQNIAAAVERRIQEATEKAKQEALESTGKKTNPYVEPQGVSAASKSGKLTQEDLDKMSFEEIRKLVGGSPL